MISASVAPLALFIIATTSAFLLARSAFGLPASFFAWLAFFAGLAFLAPMRSFPNRCRVHFVSPPRAAVVTVITQLGRNIKGSLLANCD